MTSYTLIGMPYRANPNNTGMLGRIWKDSKKKFTTLVRADGILNRTSLSHSKLVSRFKALGGKAKDLQKHSSTLRRLAKDQTRTGYQFASIYKGWNQPVIGDIPLLEEHIKVLQRACVELETAKEKGPKDKYDVSVAVRYDGDRLEFDIASRGKRLPSTLRSTLEKKLNENFNEVWMTVNMRPGEINLTKMARQQLVFKKALASFVRSSIRDLPNIKLHTNISYEVNEPILRTTVTGYAGVFGAKATTRRELNRLRTLAAGRAAAVSRQLNIPLGDITQNVEVLGIDSRGNEVRVKNSMTAFRSSWRNLYSLYRRDGMINSNEAVKDQVQSVSDLIRLVGQFRSSPNRVEPLQKAFFERYLGKYNRASDVKVSPPKQLEVRVQNVRAQGRGNRRRRRA